MPLTNQEVEGIAKILGKLLRETKEELKREFKAQTDVLQGALMEKTRQLEEHQRRLDSYRKHLDNHENKIRKLQNPELDPPPWPGRTPLK